MELCLGMNPIKAAAWKIICQNWKSMWIFISRVIFSACFCFGSPVAEVIYWWIHIAVSRDQACFIVLSSKKNSFLHLFIHIRAWIPPESSLGKLGWQAGVSSPAICGYPLISTRRKVGKSFSTKGGLLCLWKCYVGLKLKWFCFFTKLWLNSKGINCLIWFLLSKERTLVNGVCKSSKFFVAWRLGSYFLLVQTQPQ